MTEDYSDHYGRTIAPRCLSDPEQVPFYAFSNLLPCAQHCKLMRTIVKNIGFTLKRTKPVEEKRNDSTTLQKRRDFILKLAKDGIIYDKNCIFVDEASFDANLIHGEGWSKKGEERSVTTRSKRALTLTILAAISYQGVERVNAKIVRGGTTGSIFATFIQNIIDTLDKSNAPVQYFIMNNASIHETPEKEFSITLGTNLVKRKPGLTQDELALYIGECSERVTDSDCESWVRHRLTFFDDSMAMKKIY
ncbi:hypothetical protein [Parasitella parasitica]|uniref:Tc1-like transposase DDE domain-containing protein n=1 Tax=Parasitella parasitica TaxID=35722 RepID=A0A0B7N9M1_9FUNG|nr:hypothetical protein [Parasitella parasitica]